MQKILITLYVGLLAISMISTPCLADNDISESSSTSIKQHHVGGFMPNLMNHAIQSKNTLKLSNDQVDALIQYQKENAPKIQQMEKALIEAKVQAKQMAQDHENLDKSSALAKLSFDIRSNLFKAKLKRRNFVKSVLTREQYKAARRTYK